jgi:hypothetical protein
MIHIHNTLKRKNTFRGVFLLLSIFVGGFLLSSAKTRATTPTNQFPYLAAIYHNQEWEDTGTALTPQESADKFNTIVFSRTKMNTYLPQYVQAGFDGQSLVYLTPLDRIAGPKTDYASRKGQKRRCTTTDKTYRSSSDNLTMDEGDFCEIQDAIVTNTCLTEYPDLCPKESFFLHKQDSTRYVKASSSGNSYKPNPADAVYRQYLQRRAVREMIGGVEVTYNGTTINHPSTGANSVYFDNVELSWSKVVREGGIPKEFTTNEAYAIAVRDAVQQTYTAFLATTLPNSTSHPQLWGNMISNLQTGNDWGLYVTALDGALMENFLLDWGRGYYSESDMLTQLSTLKSWGEAGKKVIAVAQANTYTGREQFDNESVFTYIASLLVLNDASSFKTDNYYGDPQGTREALYKQYYEYPEYFTDIGSPLGSYYAVSGSVLKRDFTCGSVTVDLANKNAQLVQTPGCEGM